MRVNFIYTVLAGVCILSANTTAQVTLTKVADYNTPVPGAPGTTFREIGQPYVHNGQVLFYATNNAGMGGLYLYNGSTLVKVADTNTPSPGGGNLRDISFYAYALENGAVAFVASDANGPAIFFWTNQQLTRLVKNGDSIPGTASNRFNFFGQPTFDRGVLYFMGGEGESYRGVHRYDGTVSTGLVSSLQVYPGATLPHYFSAQLAVESNRLAFWSSADSQNAIFTWVNGAKNFLVSSNDTIPGTSVNFATFQSPPDMQGGWVAFKGGSDNYFQEGIFLRPFEGGAIIPVVRQGAAHPGFNTALTSFGEMAVDNGRVWFQAGGAGGQSLFLWESNRYTRLLSGGMVLDGPSTIFSSAPFTFNQNCVHQGVAALVVRFSNNTKALYLAAKIPPPSTLIAATNLAGTSTPIPGGTGNFLALGSAIPWRGGVLFTGQGAGGQFGLYHYLDGNISVILNQTTVFPGTTSTVASLQIHAVDPARVAIYAVSAGGDWGLLIYDGTTLTKVADNNTAIPGGAFGTFSSFSRAQFTGSGLTFHGTGSNNYSGVFEFNNGTLSTLVDSTRTFPGTTDSLGIVSFARQGDLLALIGQAGTNYQQTAVMLFSNHVLTVATTNGLALSDRTNRFYNSFYSLGFAGGSSTSAPWSRVLVLARPTSSKWPPASLPRKSWWMKTPPFPALLAGQPWARCLSSQPGCSSRRPTALKWVCFIIPLAAWNPCS
ncbi:hypothetical protein NXS98_13950 [Fontisphaera persica]|uniref:hypothetical protein n=1 Tax=Fontisphaera persica TaxID=2974023 RepID=UPI0024C0A701|nr:hypothetical protein [Fontisphaera persica]WCJ58811.1 hypothetical protein NXS98_13950 [Fontisphaera persica]